jgi:hypothetical protein
LKVAAVLSNRLQQVGQLFHQQVGVVRHRWFGQCDDVQVCGRVEFYAFNFYQGVTKQLVEPG